jgi:hypothetical protein
LTIRAIGGLRLRYHETQARRRPYISAARQLKPLGFKRGVGEKSYDIEPEPYGNGGFKFRLA